jgi:hypothetical protein
MDRRDFLKLAFAVPVGLFALKYAPAIQETWEPIWIGETCPSGFGPLFQPGTKLLFYGLDGKTIVRRGIVQPDR